MYHTLTSYSHQCRWVKNDTGNTSEASLLRGYAKVERLTIPSTLHPSIRYHVKMTVADDTDKSVFVSFDGEITKLTNILAADAGHLLICRYLTTQHHLPYCENVYSFTLQPLV